MTSELAGKGLRALEGQENLRHSLRREGQPRTTVAVGDVVFGGREIVIAAGRARWSPPAACCAPHGRGRRRRRICAAGL